MIGVMIALAGGLGSVLRYLADKALSSRLGKTSLPLPTLVINLTAAFLVGLTAGLTAEGTIQGAARLILTTGLLGGFSTFSTAMNETVLLLGERRGGLAAIYLALTVLLGLTAVWGGYLLVAP